MANILKKRPSLKRVGALVLALLVILTTLPTNSMLTVFAAAKKPVIAKTSTVALNGTKALKITKNGYTITSVKVKSNKSAVAQATATNSKVKVFGIKAGKAKITATVEAKKGNSSKTFKLTSTVKVKNPSAKLSTANLKVGETASVKVSNAANGAKITYTSSDNSVATVNANGIVTAVGKGTSSIKAKIVLKKTKYAKKVTKTVTAGDVTVTEEPQNGQTGNDTPAGTTTGDGTTPANTNTGATNTSTGTSGGSSGSGSSSGSSGGGSSAGSSSSRRSSGSSSSTPTTSAKVNTQAELEAALKKTSMTEVTIGEQATELTIPEGTYSNIDLIVNAPSADITNNGTFKSIEIKAIKADTWTEKGNGNRITLTNSNPVRIIVDTINALAELNFKGSGNSGKSSKVEVKNGTLTKLGMASKEKLDVVVTGGAVVGTISVSAPTEMSVSASGKSKISKVEITKDASGTDENPTKVSVKAEDGAEIENITTAAKNSETDVVSNGESKVSEVKVEGTASVTIDGNSKNKTTVDIKDASGKNQVTVNTDTVEVVAKEDQDANDIVNNKSGKELDITIEKTDGTKKETKLAVDYTIKLAADYSTGGAVTLDTEAASEGTTVTVKVTTNAGYTVDSVTWSTGSGVVNTAKSNENGVYTFTMPAADVTVTVNFKSEPNTISGLKIERKDNVYTATVGTQTSGVTYAFYYGDESGITAFNDKKLKELSEDKGVKIDIEKGTVTLLTSFKLTDKYLYVVAKANGYEDAFAGSEKVMGDVPKITLTSIKITDYNTANETTTASIKAKLSGFSSSEDGKFYLSTSETALDPKSKVSITPTGTNIDVEVEANVVSGGSYYLIYAKDNSAEAWSTSTEVKGSEFAALKMELMNPGENKTVTMERNCTVPDEKTLEVPDSVTLSIPKDKTLTNEGTITINGTIVGEGTIKVEKQKTGTFILGTKKAVVTADGDDSVITINADKRYIIADENANVQRSSSSPTIEVFCDQLVSGSQKLVKYAKSIGVNTDKKEGGTHQDFGASPSYTYYAGIYGLERNKSYVIVRYDPSKYEVNDSGKFTIKVDSENENTTLKNSSGASTSVIKGEYGEVTDGEQKSVVLLGEKTDDGAYCPYGSKESKTGSWFTRTWALCELSNSTNDHTSSGICFKDLTVVATSGSPLEQ